MCPCRAAAGRALGVWQGVMLPTFRELVFVAVISRRVGPAFILALAWLSCAAMSALFAHPGPMVLALVDRQPLRSMYARVERPKYPVLPW